MKKIGIISDTHSFWDDKYLHYFEPCDEIWHAGDICSVELAERLAAFRPLRAVCGNCDGGDLRRMFPEILRWKCEDVDVLIKHIGGYPGNYDASVRSTLYANPPQLFVAGTDTPQCHISWATALFCAAVDEGVNALGMLSQS